MGLYRAGGALLALALATIAAPAFADDGTYLGTLTFNANQPGDARHVCPGTGAMKLTVAGDKIQYESIARGARADLSFWDSEYQVIGTMVGGRFVYSAMEVSV